MIRTKGEAGTGDIIQAVRHARTVHSEIRKISSMDPDELYSFAKEIQAPYDLIKQTATLSHLPVVNFAAGGKKKPILFHSKFDSAFFFDEIHNSSNFFLKII